MTRHRLVGRGELRKLLGLSATRTIQLADRPDFPEPLDELSVGKIWDFNEVITWMHANGRTPNLAALDAPAKDPDRD